MQSYVSKIRSSGHNGLHIESNDALQDSAVYSTACEWVRNRIITARHEILPVQYKKKQDIWIGGIFPIYGHDVSDKQLSTGKSY